MTLTLKLDNKELTAKPSFAFLKKIETLGEFNESTNKFEGGLENLLQSLVTNNLDAIVTFWDAALAHHGKKAPSKSVIEVALEERVEELGGMEELFKEAYQFMTKSGFFKRKIELFWEQAEMMEVYGATEEERATNKTAYKQLMKMKKEIEA